MPHTVVLSGQTSVSRISALHAKHFISAPGPLVADTLMKPTLRPSEVAPYRCGSLLGRGLELAPYKGPVIWPIEAAGTAILGGRLVRLAETQEFWSTGGEAGPQEDWGR